MRRSRTKAPHQAAWTVALALFALASAALATGASTGWDPGTFRAFYLLGAILNVPWLALGTVYLLAGRRVGDRARAALLVFTGFAVGVMLATPLHGVISSTGGIPEGKDHLGVLPRALAGTASGIGAIVVFGGAAWSAVRFARRRKHSTDAARLGRLAAGNALIALGVLILSAGGLLQGIVGHDEAFTITLAGGIAVVYAGFTVASGQRRPATSPVVSLADPDDSARRASLPPNERGNDATSSTRVGNL